jgi:hypothetical protein
MGGRHYTADEVARLTAEYAECAANGTLVELAASLGRSVASITSKAYELKITDAHAARVRAANSAGDARRGKPLAWDHPRGMAGKTHSQETKDRLRLSSKEYRASITEDKSAEIADKMMRTRVQRYGCMAPRVSRGNWKAGWREIGGKRKYYRSRWEANYARYLEWLKSRNLIKDWSHEPETFWFDGIKRGVRSYLPDFRVIEVDDAVTFYEVKGWFDARSKTAVARMGRYHPAVKLILVFEKQYKQIAAISAHLIPDWEYSEKGKA